MSRIRRTRTHLAAGEAAGEAAEGEGRAAERQRAADTDDSMQMCNSRSAASMMKWNAMHSLMPALPVLLLLSAPSLLSSPLLRRCCRCSLLPAPSVDSHIGTSEQMRCWNDAPC